MNDEANEFQALLSDDQAAKYMGISVRKFQYLRYESWMPKPIYLGPRLLRWVRAELDAAFLNAPRVSEKAPQPEQLVRARAQKKP